MSDLTPYANDYLFKVKETDRPVLKQPDKCGRRCVQYADCKFPKNCPVLVRQRRREKQESEKHIIP